MPRALAAPPPDGRRARVVGALTVLPGRAAVQEGGVHLTLFAVFLVLAFMP